jgi:tetratricopeptide (TPR) repeat protein
MNARWGSSTKPTARNTSLCDFLLRVVDVGLVSAICLAPYVFGGRHDFGRLVLALAIAVTATAWFLRQTILPTARWSRTLANLLVLCGASLLLLQIIPLPPNWLAAVSPHITELLPLWTTQASDFGTWQTLSFNPHETTKSLAMLASYGLLFIVVAQRIETLSDIEWFMKIIAASVVAMAAFGLVHYFTTDGRFFWFYAHPFRSATNVSGAFINRNHFASFLVLGLGPLVATIVERMHQRPSVDATSYQSNTKHQLVTWLACGGLIIVILAVLSSCSRGGAMAFLVAGTVLVAFYFAQGIVDRRFIYCLIGLAIVVTGLLSLHGYDQVSARLDDFTEGSIDALDQRGIRRQLWAANISAFKDLWVAGTGAGSHSEVYPIYLPNSYNKIYTHAENGYLQIASETGIGGVFLLTTGILLCAGWAVSTFRQVSSTQEARLVGATTAGISANFAHSIVDFVWYVPACMSVTVVLLACQLRLYQLTRATRGLASATPILPRGRWIERTAAVSLIGAWTVSVFWGPGVAEIHWNRYLRASATKSGLAQNQLIQLVSGRAVASSNDYERLNDLMIHHLNQVLRWDPLCARAHLRLMQRYIAKFDLSQQKSPNAMALAQIQDAVAASQFSSDSELHNWLHRAFGSNICWLLMAADEGNRALKLCPLQGEGYLSLTELRFLDPRNPIAAESLVAQALRIRPHDADVLYSVGDLARRRGDLKTAIENWRLCFDDSGPHQYRIVFWLAGRMPAELFLSTFRPDWRTLRHIWSRYRELGQSQDIQTVLAYTTHATQRETQGVRGYQPARLWFFQSTVFAEVGDNNRALACLEKAHECDPNLFFVRRALGESLRMSGRLAEAELHLRWCLARRPADERLKNALLVVTKERLARREPFKSSLTPRGTLHERLRSN